MSDEQHKGLPDAHEDALDTAIAGALGADLMPACVADGQRRRLRERVMALIDEEPVESPPPRPVTLAGTPDLRLVTEASEAGDWIEVGPGMVKKVLHQDCARGTESFLLRLAPGASVPRHFHDDDELCVVMEGEVSFGELQIKVGDYHFAPKGSWHEGGYSERGALLYLQSALAA